MKTANFYSSSTDEKNSYPVIIIGGGLAGLCAGITLQEAGIQTLIIEKSNYPQHKVCGEYVSAEVLPLLAHFGLFEAYPHLPILKKFAISSLQGKVHQARLPLGGIGISRYALDKFLADKYENLGGHLLCNTTVNQLQALEKGAYQITTDDKKTFIAQTLLGTWGKHSNLDAQSNRNQLIDKEKRAKLIGVKYHLEADFPTNKIELHSFQGGYAGISAVEGDNTFCFCYLADVSHFQADKGNKEMDFISQLEEKVLFKNKFIKQYRREFRSVWEKPLSISRITFDKKPLVHKHLLAAGDTAGMITPLCGNGMGMAIRAGYLLAKQLLPFLEGHISRAEMEKRYYLEWTNEFSNRLWMGRRLQDIILKPTSIGYAISFFNTFPSLSPKLIKLTHGKLMELS